MCFVATIIVYRIISAQSTPRFVMGVTKNETKWLFHFIKSQYKSPQNTDTNITICNLRRNVYMKATGIVRRLEECVIIGQTA